MELTQVIQNRRSIRKFKSDPVADELIQELLGAARLAPSGTNIQPWRFVVVKTNESKQKLSPAIPLPFVTTAPVILVCCLDTEALGTSGNRMKELAEAGAFSGTPLETPSTNYKRREMDEAQVNTYLNLNCAIAIEHMVLRATDLGLGSCWIMMFDREKAHDLLGLEDRYKPIALLPIGYPGQNPPMRPRLSLDEIVLKAL